MKNFSFLLMLSLIMLLAIPSGAFAGLSQFAGKWKNIDANTRGLTTLDISVRGTRVTIQAWGQCQPQDCDWGRVSAVAYGRDVSSDLVSAANTISATFRTNFSQTLVIIRPGRGKRLRAEAFTRFTDNSRRTAYHAVYTLARAAAPAPRPAAVIREDCTSFNPHSATLVRQQGRWKIADGGHWLSDFGNNRSEALKSLEIIRHYRMNRSCFVGRPNPSFQYLLVSGRAPAGSFPGEDCVAFSPDRLEVRNINGRWKIVEGSHWVFDFGNNESEARKSLAIIRKYGFRYSCFVGRPDPSFRYLRK